MHSLRPTFPRKTPDVSEIEDPDVMDLPAVRFRCRPRSYLCSRLVAKALHEAELRNSSKNFMPCVKCYRSAVGPLAKMQALETDPLLRHSKMPSRCALKFSLDAARE